MNQINSRIFLISIIVLITFVTAIYSQTAIGWKADSALVAKLSKSRQDVNYVEEKVPSYILPDPLITLTGEKITTSGQWFRYRRPEIIELFTTHVYGRVPRTPYRLTFNTVGSDRNALGGAATLKLVDINIEAAGRNLVIHLSLFTPNSVKRAPVFLLICNRSPENIDPTRKIKSEFWPVEEAIARGYGMAAFHNADVDPDNYDEFKNGIHGIMDTEPRQNDSWGTLAAWAWGASRCLDYLVTDKDVDNKKIAVVGHSRGGKTALWAGALDQRFSMVIPNESGCGGSSLARRKYGETLEIINKGFPHWFCLNYRKFNGKEEELPVDMHMLMALIAPRALYVAAAGDDLWGDPKGSYLSLYHSLPVYRLFDKKDNLENYVPPLNKQVISGKTGFHIREGEHNLKLFDWNLFMDFADKVWK
ncbi:MAG: acetylxylan esterase [Bacteroidales bacterium]|nr:acetylxylan esterase [Bacteroidales bacterium]